MKTNYFTCCDCLDEKGLPSIQSESIHLIVADLPYEQTSNEWDKKIDIIALWKEYNRILTKDGVIALFAKGWFMIDLIMSNKEMFRYEWIWNKNKGSNFAHVRYRPLNTHEYILIFYKNGSSSRYYPQMEKGKPYKQKRKKDFIKGIADSMNRDHITISNGMRYPKSIINVKGMAQRHKIHPTQKPIGIVEYIIKTYTKKHEIILDNCAGSGTTAIACIKNQRNYICFEKYEEYFIQATKRIKNWKYEVKKERNMNGLMKFL